MSDLVLFGAGACGKHAVATLRQSGAKVSAFADNDEGRWGTEFEGLPVLSPRVAVSLFPQAEYAVTIYGRAARDVRDQLRGMGVKVRPLGSCIPVHTEVPSDMQVVQMMGILKEPETISEFSGQLDFRRMVDFDAQSESSPADKIYFPDFVEWSKDEVFVDCGAADGDTVKAFRSHHASYKKIVAFEPDAANFAKLDTAVASCRRVAVADHDGIVSFTATGNTASRVDSDSQDTVRCVQLDSCNWDDPPTFIKMDIEGSEISALQGGAETLRRYKPVLAICAYHKPADLWEIPLLIHSIVPEYDLRLRRYAEGAWELVWYAVPPGRIAV